MLYGISIHTQHAQHEIRNVRCRDGVVGLACDGKGNHSDLTILAHEPRQAHAHPLREEWVQGEITNKENEMEFETLTKLCPLPSPPPPTWLQ